MHALGNNLANLAGDGAVIDKRVVDTVRGEVLGALAGLEEPPLGFPADANAVAVVEQKAQTLLAQAGAYRELSSNLAYDDA